MSLNTLFKYWTYQVIAPGTLLREKYEAFKDLLHKDRKAHDCMAELEEIFYCRKLCDFSRVSYLATTMSDAIGDMVHDLEVMSPMEHLSLKDYYKKFNFYIRFMLAPPDYDFSPPFVFYPASGQNIIEIQNPAKSPFELNQDLVNKIGGKGAHLALLSQGLDLPVPDFFVISTNAFYFFLEFNDLNRKIAQLLSQIDLSDPQSLEGSSSELMHLIRSSKVPDDIISEITEYANEILERSGRAKESSHGFFSVRSSAVAEDSENSFAGQYLTRLNVPLNQLCDAYLDVLASKYSPSALTYRIMHGMLDLETPMAVVVQEMIDPIAAGILYTEAPERQDEEHGQEEFGEIVIHAVPGLGETAVNGEVSPDRIYLRREKPHSVISRQPGKKEKKMVCLENGDIAVEQVRPEDQKHVCIDDETALKLAEWGMKAENFFGSPQDMEWCVDKNRGILCLQTRPFTLPDMENYREEGRTVSQKPILEGRVTASPGRAWGKAFVIKSREHLMDVPDGAVVVARSIPPSYVAFFSRIAAIISEEAVSASHAATVAREARLPFLSGVQNACSRIETGMTITVDASGMKIYEGKVADLLEDSQDARACVPEDSPFMAKLRYIMKFILKLNLVDHESPEFKPENCRTLHDILRFCHEKAMQGMFSLGDRKRGSARGAKKLDVNLPINFFVIDAGGGVAESAVSKKELTIDDISCRPMLSIWKGLSDPAIAWDEGEHFDWGEYDSIVLGGGIISKDSPALASYAIISSDYMNLSIRFGYHFVVIDALETDTPANNYITFRFSGGGGDDEGRFRRATLLKLVLEELGFEVDLKGELVDAVFRHASAETLEEVLPVLGRLLGATRLMDMRLGKDDNLKELAEQFMKGRCNFASAG